MSFLSHASNPARNGFTLLELMVVVLIMGLIVGLVSVNVEPDERSLLQLEAQRLAQLLELAAEEARVSGTSFAWLADSTSYQFQQEDAASGWIAVKANDSLRPRQLPAGISLRNLQIENNPATESLRIEFPAYGQTTAFVLELQASVTRAQITMSPLGILQVVLLDADDTGAS